MSLVPLELLEEGMGAKSGTSQATPHASGALLNCYMSGECAGLTGAAAAKKIVAAAKATTLASPDKGFKGDPTHPVNAVDKYYGFLLDASAF